MPTSSAGASSAVASSSDDPDEAPDDGAHLLEMQLLREVRHGRHGQRREEPVHRARRRREEVPVPAQDLRELLDRPHRRAGDDGRSDRVRAELELRDDAEVPAAAAQRPEQLRVLVGARVHPRAVGQHHLGADEAVDGEAEAAREVADAAAEREPADAGRGDDRPTAWRGRAPRSPRRRRPTCSRRPRGRSRVAGSTTTSLQAAEVDDDRVVRDAEAAAVVAAAADGDALVVRAGEREHARDVLRARADDDRGGALVDHAVVDGAGVVVAGVAGADDAAGRARGGRGVRPRQGRLVVLMGRRYVRPAARHDRA